MAAASYSTKAESARILDLLLSSFKDGDSLPVESIQPKRGDVKFTGSHDKPYFPIPFKETETTAALKAIEGILATLLADTKGKKSAATTRRTVTVDHEKTTAFLFQAYLARIGGLGKLDRDVRKLLKGESATPPGHALHTDI
jgi:hypothetical protein